jgi:nucleoid-associated protein YgaU
VSDTLPPGFVFRQASEGWECSADQPALACTSTRPLPAGRTSTLDLAVDVAPDAQITALNVATVRVPAAEPAASGVVFQAAEPLVAGASVEASPSPVAGRPPPNTGVTGEASTQLVYVVQGSETLSDIAETVYGDASRADDLYLANRESIDAHGIVPGLVLVVP